MPIILLFLLLFAVPCHAGETASPKDLVVILHGFGRTAHHMRYMKQYFEGKGYEVFTPTLPTFIRSVDECAGVLAEKMAEREGGENYGRVHFVGHSMGGLIIRRYLAEHEVARLGRCVLVGTPNGGTPLAAIAKTYLTPLTWISPAYQSFQPGGELIGEPRNIPAPEIGVIAGNGDGLLLGGLIKEQNDGMVPVEATKFAGMTGFILLPYNHDRLPYEKQTAMEIERFLTTGGFSTTQ